MSGVHPHQPILVIGATFAGIGLACAARRDVMVVEPSTSVGHEFIQSLHSGENWSSPPHTAISIRYAGELARRKLLLHGQANPPGLAPVLFQLIKEEELDIHLLTEIISIEEDGVGFRVLLGDVSGLRELTVRQIVDTTMSGRYTPYSPQETAVKSIHALLHHTKQHEAIDQLPDLNGVGGVRLEQGFYPGELLLKLTIDLHDDWTAARSKLHRFWSCRPASLQQWTMTSVADVMHIKREAGPRCYRPGWVSLPSGAYANPLQAMDAGYVYSEERGHHAIVATDQ
ncbi:hypothetical protein EBB07_19260 [Paenibacillaceae bacterium]|nr:hypothetical protein EBB07_19260 [Paenibacillaceae bacterium]